MIKTLIIFKNRIKNIKNNFRYALLAVLMSSNVTVVKLAVSTVFHLSGIVCVFFKCVGHVEPLIG